ncbi:hypothetical protein V6Z12_A07G134000 [Gossypium hirsutum]
MDPSRGLHQVGLNFNCFVFVMQEMGNPLSESMVVNSKGQQQQERKARPQPEEALKCPRCESTNTKFCYYNNYSLSQPRYFCKSCRRYWTKGGNLRNVPVGGGCRKNKRSSSKRTQDHAFTPSANPLITPHHHPIPPLTYDIDTNDLTLAFATVQEQSTSGQQLGFDDHDGDLSIFGNPSFNGNALTSSFLGNHSNFQSYCYDNIGMGGATTGLNGETMLPYNNQEMIDSTMAMGQDSENRVLWGLPWQLIAADNNMVGLGDLDLVRDNWNGLLNTPLM